MTKATFDQIIAFLEGAYGRQFDDNQVMVAWGIFSRMDEHLVGLAAKRMVEEGEESPSPMRWLRRVKTLQQEAREDQIHRQAKTRVDELRRLTGRAPRYATIAQPRRSDETDQERITYLQSLVGTEDQDGIAKAGDCRDLIELLLNHMGERAPKYPGMGLNQILAVRELEKQGVAHEEALQRVGGKS